MQERKSFLMYLDYINYFEYLEDAELGRLIRAFFEYVLSGSEIDDNLSGAAKMLYKVMQNQYERDNEAYQEKCRTNRENGLKGGRPPKNRTVLEETQKTERFLEKPKKPDNDNDNDNDIDNDIDIRQPHAHQSDKIPFAEFVTMTNAEHAALIEKYGESDTNRMIEILNNYKGSTGKEYKSDYRAILSWVVDRLSSEKSTKQNNSSTYLTTNETDFAALESAMRNNT